MINIYRLGLRKCFQINSSFNNPQFTILPLKQNINIRLSLNMNQNKKLTNKISYSYLTPVDKPIQSITLNSIIQLSAQSIYFPFIQWSLPAQISVILGGIVFRILIQFSSKLFQEMLFKNQNNRLIGKFIQKVFMVDLNRDIKFYEIDQRKAYMMHQYYKASYIFKNLLTAYLSLSFFRGCFYILSNSGFDSFIIHTSWFPSLASYDPNFILPLIPMLLTYNWISKSRHPFLIHLVRQQNFFYRINIAFMSGLLFVPLPVIYTLGYVGLLSGHLLVRKIGYEINDLKEEGRELTGLNRKFIEQMQRRQTDQLRRKFGDQKQQIKKQKQQK